MIDRRLKLKFAFAAALLCATLCAGCGVKEAVPETVLSDAVSLSSAPAEEQARVAAPPPAPVFTNIIAANEDKLSASIDKICSSYGVLGGSVAAFEHDEIIYNHSYGTASISRGTKADINTKYRIASISKVPTMMLAMTLVEQDKLSLDDDVAQLLSPNLQNFAYPNDKATVEMLMSHTSGIVDGGGYVNALNYAPFPPLESVLRGNVFSGSRPGEECVYSNFGMGLVSGIIEQASGEYFYDYARDTLFEPLGVDAAYITDYIEDKNSIASFYNTDPLSWGDMKPLYSQIPKGQMYLLGHGELYISANDLAKIGIILAGDGTYGGVSYLTQQSLDNIHTERAYEEETNATRGLAVQITDDIIEGTRLYGHQGNAYGAISCMFYEPDSERGVVFLTNGASSMRADSMVYAVNDAIVKEVWQYL